jgi:C1A family cysteine protease
MRAVWYAAATLMLVSTVPSAPRLEAQEDRLKQRELTAAPKITGRLQMLRAQITLRKYAFQVGYTKAMDYRMEQLAGLVPPPNLRARIQEKRRVMRTMAAAPAPAGLAGCSATASSFDWREKNGSTPVRDQGGCGSCWAFATHGAFEGRYALRNNFFIDSSEQDTLDCNSAGWGCGGGWWAYDDLISRGAARESAYPYTASKGACRAAPRRYHAEAWDYVSDADIPTDAEVKQALCEHGPLGIAVNVTDAFVGYAGGVFDACAQRWQGSTSYVPGDVVYTASGYMFECTKAGTSAATEPSWPPPPPPDPPDVIDNTVVWSYRGYINHGVTLIGWDDGKQAWLIKNSWGTDWGETGGHGSERGYMWIKRSCNNVGAGASWVRAKACTGGKCDCS